MRLFTIGSVSKSITAYELDFGPGGIVEVLNPVNLIKHDDVVKDILVIESELYSLLVSCSMNGQIYFWDLETLAFKYSRSGFSSCVHCLAYDGKSVVFAGGLECAIIAWDLDADIDKPLFNLWGHSSPIVRIVSIGSENRCVSLDAAGYIFLWDVNKENPNDKELRKICQTHCLEDHVRCFDIIPHLIGEYDTMHRMAIAGQGRRMHTYKIIDYTAQESAPVQVLYSEKLLSIISIHMNDILFWSAISGDEQMKKENVGGGNGVELTAAVLDDRLRKLIIGDSEGRIVVYNCISGVKLKEFPTVPYAIRYLLYTPNKIVISLAGPGDLYIFDELPNDSDANFYLRETKAHEADVVSIAYSHKLGLIATADCTGTLKLWNFEHLQIDTIIHNCLGGNEIGQIAFIDTLPLLLLSDSIGNFTIYVCGYAAKLFYGKSYWSVETSVFKSIATTATATDCDYTADGGGVHDSHTATHYSDNEHYLPPLVMAEEVDVEGGEDSLLKKPYSYRRMQDYLLNRRINKCIQIHVRGNIATPSGGNDDSIVDKAATIYAKMKAEDLKRRRFLAGIDVDDASDSDRASDADNDADNETEARATAAAATTVREVIHPEFPDDIYVYAVCGYDDGTVSIIDLTIALREINIGFIPTEYEATANPSYHPRRTVKRYLKDFEINNATWSEKEVAVGEHHCNASLIRVWDASKGSINNISLIGSYNDILTSSDDSAIMLYTIHGYQKGILTRGRIFDKSFKPRWKVPIDMHKRSQHRKEIANELVKQLELDIYSMGDMGPCVGVGVSVGVDDDIVGDDDTEVHHVKDDSPYALNSITKHKVQYDLPPDNEEIVRVIGQLDGKATYVLSTRDIAMEEMKVKTMHALQDIISIDGSSSTHSKIKKSTSNRSSIIKPKYLFNDSNNTHSNSSSNSNSGRDTGDSNADNPFEDSKYMSNIMHDKKAQPVAAVTGALPVVAKERNIKSKYDIEIAQLDANDPNNWEIQSSNRQRLMYKRLYYEYSKLGLTKDILAVFIGKLNAVSPNNDFAGFVDTIRRGTRKDAKSQIKAMEGTHVTAIAAAGGGGNAVDATDMDINVYYHKHTFDNIYDVAPTSTAHTVDQTASSMGDDLSSRSGSALTITIDPIRPIPLLPPLLHLEATHTVDATSQHHANSKRSSPKKTTSPVRSRTYSALSLDKAINPSKQQQQQQVKKKLMSVKDIEVEEERMSNIQYIDGAVSKFDSNMQSIDRLFKQAQRRLKRYKRKLVKDHDMDASVTSLSSSASSSSVQVSPTTVVNNPRNMVAQLLLSKSSSMTDMLAIGQKQQVIELKIEQKIKMTMDGSFHTHRDTVRRTDKRMKVPTTTTATTTATGNNISSSSSVGSNYTSQSSKGNSSKQQQQQLSLDDKLLHRSTFGPYRATELLTFFNVWKSIPPIHAASVTKEPVHVPAAASRLSDGDGDGDNSDGDGDGDGVLNVET